MRFLSAASVVLCVLAHPADAGTPPCECYNSGFPLSTEPFCTCQCVETYLGPFCEYRIEDPVQVQVWYNLSSETFHSWRAVRALNSLLDTNVSFVLAEAGNFDATGAVFKMSGGHAYNLKIHALNTSSFFMQSQRILDVYDKYLFRTAAPTARDAPRVLAEEGRFVLTLESVLYVAVALVVVLAMGFVESCCGSNNDDTDIAADITEGRWHPTEGYDHAGFVYGGVSRMGRASKRRSTSQHERHPTKGEAGDGLPDEEDDDGEVPAARPRKRSSQRAPRATAGDSEEPPSEVHGSSGSFEAPAEPSPKDTARRLSQS